MVPLSEGSSPEPQPSTSDDVPVSEPVREPLPVPSLTLAEDESGAEGESIAEYVTQPRRYPSTLGGACYLLLLFVAVVGFVVVGLGHWRGGVHVLAGVMAAAALLRVVLPRRDAGMLAVRSRWFDVTLLAVVGVALWVLATTTPNQV